jgi:signal transduction histidine kinase
VDAWLTRMYERHGPRYVDGTIVALFAVGLLGLVPAVIQIVGHYEGLSLGQSAVTLLVADGLVLIGALVPIALQLRRIRALRAWSSGDRGAETASLAHRASFETPRALATSIAITAVFLPLLAACFLALQLSDHHVWSDYAALTLVVVVSAGMGGVVTYFFLDLAFRPIRATFHETSVQQAEGSLATRLILFLTFMILDAGLWVGVLNVTRSGDVSDLALGVVGGAALVTLIQALVLVFLLSGTVLGPIHDLIAGTRSITAGELGSRVPVTTSDEFAELTTSFNRMAEELGRRTEELEASRARIVASSDEARRKVERDLHDGAQQHLVLLDLKLGMLKRSLESDPARAAEIAVEAKADLDQALSELRDLAHGIYPSVLGNDGLTPALEEAANRSAIPATVEANGAGRYPPELEAAVYFCCLEALQNAGKYAGKDAKATVALEQRDGRLVFSVTDDGRGFDPASVNGSTGIQNMSDRIGALGGEVRIDSTPGEGTTVAGSVPAGGRDA